MRFSLKSSLFSPVTTGLIAVALALALPHAALAKEFVIPVEQTTIDGAQLGVEPGDTILIAAGKRPFLQIRHVVGTAKKYVTLRNHGGEVVLQNTDHHHNILVESSRYFHLTGTGVPGLTYGFHLQGTGPDGSGVAIAGFSSDCEVDHLHIEHPGYSGMLIKTDGAIGAYMDNVNLHHNYIHDAYGEGFYIGETKTPGQVFRHLQVWNNIVARTGWESCQLANATEDVRVHHNVFYRGGLRQILWQENNQQLSSYTTCELTDNIVIHAYAHLLVAFGGLPKTVRNNYFEETVSTAALGLNDSNVAFLPNTSFTIADNFFRGIPSVQPVILFNGAISVVKATNNVWEGGNEFIKAATFHDLSQKILLENNRQEPVPRPQFIDEAHDDFRLKDGDPYKARGIGLLP